VEVFEGNLLDRAFTERAFLGVDYVFATTQSDHDGTEVRRNDLGGM